MIKKIISGFQNGVDIGAIKAAKYMGVETSGWIPRGYKTLDGARPAYASLYNAKQHSSANYAERTWDNILSSDGTLMIATNIKSAGEKCTLNGVKAHQKPNFQFWVQTFDPLFGHCYINEKENNKNDFYSLLYSWILINNIQVLNVAGNSEKTSPGIEEIAYNIIVKLIKIDRWYNELG